jgi:hypothetical protein
MRTDRVLSVGLLVHAYSCLLVSIRVQWITAFRMSRAYRTGDFADHLPCATLKASRAYLWLNDSSISVLPYLLSC